MIKIYLGEKRIFLVEEYTEATEVKDVSNATIHYCHDLDALKATLDVFEITDVENLILIGEESKTMQMLKKIFKTIQAGGGVIMNERGSILFIFRRGKWDLPKGKLDPGETIEQCAIREVKEETSIKDLRILQHLCYTYHLYVERGDLYLKETVWYTMLSSDRFIKPQESEGITKVEWGKREKLDYYTGNTYQTIVDIFDELKRQRL
jgi:8-oxo-dGTP pyrophosphatase MutT (NUDIX family)